ncbi:SET domain-containing protein [Ceratobasidium sp. AG-Ba]|nr:SET domain-containing protein [Ceratobasidium sp. AG-Ba]
MPQGLYATIQIATAIGLAKYTTFHRSTRKHPGEQGRGPLYPKFSTPKLKVDQLIAQAKRENSAGCDNDCFLSLEGPTAPDDSNDEIIVHDEGDELSRSVIEELELNWKQLPDATPCDIAIFGGGSYTCRQAYQIRNKLFPDTALESDDSEVEVRRRGKQKAPERKHLPAFQECEHDGPCDGNPKCSCFTERRFCLRDCRCDLNYSDKRDAHALGPQVLTFVGQISVNAQHKGESVTPSYARAAVPSVHGVPCRNTQLLLQRWKETKVKPSTHGNGLFLVSERAVKGDLIAEYTGEILYGRTEARRSPIYTKTGRNYLFIVNSDGLKYTIDAAAAGNESRFINHPPEGKRINCKALWRYVGGVLRLGIYADRHIFKNEELFLDYGPEFTFSQPTGAEPPSRNENQGQLQEALDSDGMEDVDDGKLGQEMEEMDGTDEYEDDEAELSSSSSIEL